MPCRYKGIFGNVKEGIHSYRVLDIAIFDVIFTIIFAYIFHLLNPGYKFIYILIALFALGIMMHRFFCVRTTIDKMLFAQF